MAARKKEREQAAMNKLFEQHSYVGGRLPDILDPATPPDTPQAPKVVPIWDPPSDDVEEERPKRGARSEKTTGLQIVITQIQRNGFPHPLKQGNFLMLPKVFKALLSLEQMSVIQVVYEILDRTIGWADKKGEHGRREWARLSHHDFEMSCGMSKAQVKRGLKGALQKGYIIRRGKLDSFEYCIRWAEE